MIDIFHHGFTNGNRVFWKTNFGTNILLDSGVCDDGFWHHLVAVWQSATSHEFYRDGIIRASNYVDTAGPWTGATDRYIGKYSVSDYWDGHLALAAAYTRALSPSEIQQLYADPWATYQQRRRVFASAGTAPVVSAQGTGRYYYDHFLGATA